MIRKLRDKGIVQKRYSLLQIILLMAVMLFMVLKQGSVSVTEDRTSWLNETGDKRWRIDGVVFVFWQFYTQLLQDNNHNGRNVSNQKPDF